MLQYSWRSRFARWLCQSLFKGRSKKIPFDSSERCNFKFQPLIVTIERFLLGLSRLETAFTMPKPQWRRLWQ
ncbi:hypothetical protein [Myxosarcina sp. GI1]|uniref:hypothetical protein n=1 Tax=Myxosarcina sp. GI1 TaxID=1541065 RepID=UPI0012E08033|nr:hypothetical protein [Myxosarcina sp. GI1]